MRVLAAFIATTLLLARAPNDYAQDFLPGRRVLLDAHNCYPYLGQWSNRLDRALATGLPLAIEEDLAWDTSSSAPRIVVCHGSKASPRDPTLKEYFFERVRPLVEQALTENDRRQWPLITLNINDLRAEDPAFFTALWALTEEYDSWLCQAHKTENIAQIAALELKPLLILTSDGPRQFKAFYEHIPVGGRLRMFASGDPGKNSDNFRRWVNYSWTSVEPEGQPKAGDWSAADAARLAALVSNAHRREYWIRIYTLNGHRAAETLFRGWGPDYNFGSLESAVIRWRAAKAAGVDFLSSDQYEECGKILRRE